ncbi:hypothetical protein [Methylosinus sp. R-45379]|uniref:hypothetical protein n=1 Tax=Methylosinus sp. R-45379 TaxID=980563 RepID=UPI000A3F07B9|nr:hypothetical protein [Methylosinus sp. R-45379]
MSQDKRKLARGIERELVNEYPAFANVPKAERERLADYWSEDSYVDEFGVLRSVNGEALRDSLRYALADKAGSAVAVSTPATGVEKRHSNGLTDADIEAIKDPQRRLEVLAEVEGGCRVVPSWQRGAARPVTVAEITQRTGLTPEDFAALPPDRKLQITDEVKFGRNGGAL